jgi:hypothetical protein
MWIEFATVFCLVFVPLILSDPGAVLTFLWIVMGFVGAPMLAIVLFIWAIRQATLAAEDIIAAGVAKGRKSDR